MKFIAHLIAVVLVSGLVQYLMPWWAMAAGVFVVALLFRHNGYISFIAGFAGVAVLWMAVAYFTDDAAGSALASRVAKILPVGSVGALIGVTALVGGLVGGFASMTGGLITAKAKSKY